MAGSQSPASAPNTLAGVLQSINALRQQLDGLDGDTSATVSGLIGPTPKNDPGSSGDDLNSMAGIINQISSAVQGCFPVIARVEANHGLIRGAIG